MVAVPLLVTSLAWKMRSGPPGLPAPDPFESSPACPGCASSVRSAEPRIVLNARRSIMVVLVVRGLMAAKMQRAGRLGKSNAPISGKRSTGLFVLAVFAFFDLAIPLFRALERLGRAHGLAPVAQQGHHPAEQDQGNDEKRDDE